VEKITFVDLSLKPCIKSARFFLLNIVFKQKTLLSLKRQTATFTCPAKVVYIPTDGLPIGTANIVR